MKEKLQEAYDLLDGALNTCGDWKMIAEEYESAMVEVMDLLNEMMKG